MSFNREKMDLVADEFRFFPCNVANLLARHQHEYDAATTDEERGAALRRWLKRRKRGRKPNALD